MSVRSLRPIISKKYLAVAAAALLGVAVTQVEAVARGGAHGGFGRTFGHAFNRDHFHDFRRQDFEHGGHHDRFGHHFARRDSGHEHAHGGDGHFGHSRPGHWQLSSGFGGSGHWSRHGEGVWSR